MIMFPIPVSIIGSNKRIFIPLVYLAVTASICYIFLIALVKINPNRYNNSNFPFKKKSVDLDSQSKSKNFVFQKFKREVEASSFFDGYSSIQRNLSESNSWKSNKKKRSDTGSDSNLLTANANNQKTSRNGTRRSYPPKIWVDHQEIIDHSAPSISPWPKDKQCSQFKIHFAKKNTFKPRALVSFPGSGNSWLRHLIECSTGFFTGSVFNDEKIYGTGLLGEFRAPNDGSTIVQKTHHDALRFSNTKSKLAYVKLTELMFGYRGILLLRNPYDALISYWNFIETHDHRGLAKKFNRYNWQNFVVSLIPKWTSLIMDWAKNSQSLLIVEYEKLKKNPHYELIRILHHLDQSVDEDRLSCLLKETHVEGPFHRKRNSSSFTNNPFLLTTTLETKDKNLLALNPEQNSKSLRNHSSASLDLIVQDNIKQINRFFSEKYIPIFLNYTAPAHCCPAS